MLDENEYPFSFDHSKCFNCQIVPNLSEEERNGIKVEGSTWQKGVHLCSSCQWHLAMMGLDIRREEVIKRELSRIESVLSDYNIYFDEITPEEAIRILDKEPRDQEIEEAIKDLKQIIKLGFNKLKVIA